MLLYVFGIHIDYFCILFKSNSFPLSYVNTHNYCIMKNVLMIILTLLFVSCTRNPKSKSASSVNRGDSLYVIDVDNIAEENSINYSSYFKSIKPYYP